jgi:hypothetical protein
MTASLSVLKPTTITSATLSSSTVAENDYPAWSSATAYAKDDFCISQVTHRIYQCMAPNTGKDPTSINNQAGTVAYWLDVGPTNRWAMFDGEVNTQTIAPLSLTVVLQPGPIDAIYLTGLEASHIEIVVKSAPGGDVIYSQSAELEASAPDDYWEYFFDPFKPLTDFLVSDLAPWGGAEVTVTLSALGGDVKCGALAVGQLHPLGRTQRGAAAKPKTYSYIKTDDFGRTEIKRRKSTTDMTASAYIDIAEASAVTELLQSLLDVPTVWIGSSQPEYRALRVFGLGSGDVVFNGPSGAELSLTVQGLI